MDHCPLRRSQGALELALHSDLLQVFASGKKASAFGRAIWQEQLAQPCTEFKQGRKQDRGQFEHAGKLSERTKWKSAEKRFGKNREQKQIDRKGDRHGYEVASIAPRSD